MRAAGTASAYLEPFPFLYSRIRMWRAFFHTRVHDLKGDNAIKKSCRESSRQLYFWNRLQNTGSSGKGMKKLEKHGVSGIWTNRWKCEPSFLNAPALFQVSR